MKTLKEELKRAEKRLKFLMHADNAHIAKLSTIVKLENEISFLKRALEETT